jgi:phosphatidylserine/phosphatidylglycerophosphate/cardiolipin synthase-like enzyme
LTPDEKDLDRLSGIMAKQTGRFEESLIQASMDNLFKIAQGKMESDHDKKVLTGLRAMVRELEETLYRPHSRYQDAFFFPNMANVKKLVGYIDKAKKSIDLAIFSFTNDDLANALLAAHERGVALRIITDDEAMKGKGADTQRMADAGVPCRTDAEE